MDLQIVKAALSSRKDFDVLVNYVSPDKYQKEFKYVIKFIGDYYRRDPDSLYVDVPLLKAQIAEVTDNDKHTARFHEFIDSAAATETSGANVTALVISAKLHENKLRLATAFANNDEPDKIRVLMDEYNKLEAATTLSDLEEGEEAEVYENIDVSALSQARLARGALLELYPRSLNNRIDGGLEGGDHVVIYGPTESGKTAEAIQACAGFAYQSKKGLYLGNEDPTARLAMRMVSCLSGMDKFEIANFPEKAQRLANDRGLGNIKLIGITPGSLNGITALVEKYDPAWVVLDQLRNIHTGTRNNRVVQLEEAATGFRNILKASNTVGISITQAGDSAKDKIFLDTGDVDFSNVGIPATADLMVGINANEELKRTNTLGISLPKNKLSGDHSHFYAQLVPHLSQVRDISATHPRNGAI